MRRDAKIIAVTVLSAGVWVAAGRVPEMVRSTSFFRVQEVEVVGLHFVSREEVLKRLGITPRSTVWGDSDAWSAAVAEHPLVRTARVSRRLPGTLVVEVEERRPVALVATPILEPVDAEGVILSLDPTENRLDLPLLRLQARVAPGARMIPASGRRLASEVGRLMEADTAFLQMVSEVEWREEGVLAARWTRPDVVFLLRAGAPPRRVREGITIMADAVGRDLDRLPSVIDLRYADQAVVRRTRNHAS
ncbi:MAG: cell division protein FtsQ/DivIB [Gemmatimonadota bacterium]